MILLGVGGMDPLLLCWCWLFLRRRSTRFVYHCAFEFEICFQSVLLDVQMELGSQVCCLKPYSNLDNLCSIIWYSSVSHDSLIFFGVPVVSSFWVLTRHSTEEATSFAKMEKALDAAPLGVWNLAFWAKEMKVEGTHDVWAWWNVWRTMNMKYIVTWSSWSFHHWYGMYSNIEIRIICFMYLNLRKYSL